MKTLLIFLALLIAFGWLTKRIKWKYWFLRIPVIFITIVILLAFALWLYTFSGLIPTKENFSRVSKSLPERRAWVVQDIPMEDHLIIYKFYASPEEVQSLIDSYNLHDEDNCYPAFLYTMEKPWFNDDGCDEYYCNMKNTEAQAFWLAYDKESGKVLFCDFST